MFETSFSGNDHSLAGSKAKLEGIESQLEKLKRDRDELILIHQLNGIIISSLDINQVYEGFIEKLRQVVDVDWATIILIEGDELHFFALSSRFGSLWRPGEVIPLEGTAVQWVAKHKQTFMELDLAKERRFWTGEHHRKQGVRSIVCLPLMVRGKVFATLIIASRRPYAYGEKELPLLELIAKQISTPVDNARLFEESKRRQEILQTISHVTRIITSNADIAQIYETFAQEVKKLAPFDRISIDLKEGGKVKFLVVFSTVPVEPNAGDTIPLEGSVLQWLIECKRINIEDDFLKERQFPVDELHLKGGLRSAIRVPLVAKGEVFGSLNLTSSKPNAYNEWHKEVLEQLAAQISGAIDNARLYQVEKALRENIADIIVLIDLKGNIDYISRGIEEETGHTREEVEGKNIKELLTPESYRVANERIRKRMEGVKSLPSCEIEVIAKDGNTVLFELNTRPVMVGDELTGIQIVARNITERKREEHRKAQFLNVLTHELKVPLTPLLSSAKLLAEELEPKGGIDARLARNTLGSAFTLSSRLDELTELAKGSMGLLKVNAKSFQPKSLIQRLASQCSTMFTAKKQKFQQELESPLPNIFADKERTGQVLLNLLSNANKFSPEESQVILRARAEEGTLVIEVEDNGAGISVEEQQRIFDPYYHSDSSHGLGLGLAICKQLVELQGGEIWCHSRVGKGSVFGFSLPLAGKTEE